VFHIPIFFALVAGEKPPWRRDWYAGNILTKLNPEPGPTRKARPNLQLGKLSKTVLDEKLSKTERFFENVTTLRWQNCRQS